jgi:hypothetical protein
MQADYVDKLYGVPEKDKPHLRELINEAAQRGERNVVPLQEPLPSPEEILFGATQEAQKYEFRQRGDYFFVQRTPALVMDNVVGRLEEIVPTIDLPPSGVDKIREEVTRYVNYVAQTYWGKNTADQEVPLSYFVEELDNLVNYPQNSSERSIFSVIKDITLVLESYCNSAEILFLGVKP